MPLRNVVVAVIISVGMLLLVVELVRRRKLREEYSWLWLLTISMIVVLSVWFRFLEWISSLIGAVVPSSTIFFLAFLFLVFISLHFSVVVSKLTNRNIELAQRYAFLESEMNELKKQVESLSAKRG
jgi:cell division protein FtsB